MASSLIMWQIVAVFLVASAFVDAKPKPEPITLTDDTWPEVLKGEWMVKFYAPWCPACKHLTPVWEELAGWAEDLGINVAHIDLTEHPALSGRFLITALPTIYHVKDGEFRMYRGARDEKELISFVDEKKWQQVEPMAWYRQPTSSHMALVGGFFKLSIAIRDLHNKMTEEYGIPVWGSYTIFALATIVVGLTIGLLLVCLCDFVCPPKQFNYSNGDVRRRRKNDSKDDDESDVVEDDRYDAVTPAQQKQHQQQQQQQDQQDQQLEQKQEQPDVRPKSAAARRRVTRTD